jgi:hypothetical protein
MLDDKQAIPSGERPPRKRINRVFRNYSLGDGRTMVEQGERRDRRVGFTDLHGFKFFQDFLDLEDKVYSKRGGMLRMRPDN